MCSKFGGKLYFAKNEGNDNKIPPSSGQIIKSCQPSVTHKTNSSSYKLV